MDRESVTSIHKNFYLVYLPVCKSAVCLCRTPPASIGFIAIIGFIFILFSLPECAPRYCPEASFLEILPNFLLLLFLAHALCHLHHLLALRCLGFGGLYHCLLHPEQRSGHLFLKVPVLEPPSPWTLSQGDLKPEIRFALGL